MITLNPARIEAAARALWSVADGDVPFDALHPDEQDDVARDALKVLVAAFPEMAFGVLDEAAS